MGHYEARLQQDLDHIRDRVAAVADQVRGAVDAGIRGLLAYDQARLYSVVLGDHPINREIRAIDALCHTFVARHLPSAGPLRFVSSVLRLTIALERIGDYAVTIGRVSVKLGGPLPEAIAEVVGDMNDQALRMLERAIQSFIDDDPQLARDTAKLAGKVDRVHDRVFEVMIADEDRPHVDVVSALTVFGRLERVSDQAKNICELALFSTLGEVKAPKIYTVLFVDRTNALHSAMAQALAEKAFPNSGRYESAGWEPAEALDEGLIRLADRVSIDLPHAPVALRPLRPSPAEYHVVVVINGPDAPPGADPVPHRRAPLGCRPRPLGAGGPRPAQPRARGPHPRADGVVAWPRRRLTPTGSRRTGSSTRRCSGSSSAAGSPRSSSSSASSCSSRPRASASSRSWT